MLGRRLNDDVQNKEQVRDALVEEWNNLSQQMADERRNIAIISSRGESIRY